MYFYLQTLHDLINNVLYKYSLIHNSPTVKDKTKHQRRHFCKIDLLIRHLEIVLQQLEVLFYNSTIDPRVIENFTADSDVLQCSELQLALHMHCVDDFFCLVLTGQEVHCHRRSANILSDVEDLVQSWDPKSDILRADACVVESIQCHLGSALAY